MRARTRVPCAIFLFSTHSMDHVQYIRPNFRPVLGNLHISNSMEARLLTRVNSQCVFSHLTDGQPLKFCCQAPAYSWFNSTVGHTEPRFSYPRPSPLKSILSSPFHSPYLHMADTNSTASSVGKPYYGPVGETPSEILLEKTFMASGYLTGVGFGAMIFTISADLCC